MKSIVSAGIILFSLAGWTQINRRTQGCIVKARETAAAAMAKDSKTKGSVLNNIGFVAETCSYNKQSELIECKDKKGVIQFEASLDSSDVENEEQYIREMSYQFVTGTQGLNVYYSILIHEHLKGPAHYCEHKGTTVFEESYED